MSKNKNRKKKFLLTKQNVSDELENDRDDIFAFIVGYTSGGAPYGITHEEMKEIENEDAISENDNYIIDQDETCF